MAEFPNRSPLVEGVTWAMFAIALPPVLVRTWARLSLTKTFGIDDWLMVFAMISFTFNTVICYEGAVHGTGRHYWNLELDSMTTAFEWWYFAYLTYCTSMILAKSSIACFLLRLTPDRNHRIIVYLAWGLTVLCGIAFFFIAMFQCRPISYFWTRVGQPDGGSCITVDVIVDVTYTYSSFSILTDFAFTILPIWMVWKLQMDLKTKLVLVPILSMAAVASSAVVVRLAYVENFRGNDFLWSTADIAIWSQVEIGLAIAAGSLATLRPFFRRILHRFGLTDMSQPPNVIPNPPLGDPGLIPSDRKNACPRGKDMSPISRMMAPYSLFSLRSNLTSADDRDIQMEEGVRIPARGGQDIGSAKTQEINSSRTGSRDSLMNSGLTTIDDAKSAHDSCYSKVSLS